MDAVHVSAMVTRTSAKWPKDLSKVSPTTLAIVEFTARIISASLRSHFSRGLDGWVAEEEGKNIQDRTIFNAYKKIIGVQSMEAPAFFLAPKNFLRNQLASYGQLLKFKLKIGKLNGRR